MKKLWSRYSYVIILVGLSIAISFVLSFQVNSFHEDQYIKVTVSAGDTLWKIADQYSGQSLPSEKFISWVKIHNNIEDDQIYPGDQILIPVSKKSLPKDEYASVAK